MEIQDMLARMIWDAEAVRIRGSDDSGYRHVLVLRRNGEFVVWFEDERDRREDDWCEECELCGLRVWDSEDHEHYTADEADELEEKITNYLETGVLRLETLSGETIGVRYL